MSVRIVDRLSKLLWRAWYGGFEEVGSRSCEIGAAKLTTRNLIAVLDSKITNRVVTY